MTVQQTIEVPADRRVVIEVPESFDSGEVSVILCKPFPKTVTRSGKAVRSLRDLRGCCRGLDTMDAYFERHRADNELEYAIDERTRQESGKHKK
jgi:hypothetical protein